MREFLSALRYLWLAASMTVGSFVLLYYLAITADVAVFLANPVAVPEYSNVVIELAEWAILTTLVGVILVIRLYWALIRAVLR